MTPFFALNTLLIWQIIAAKKDVTSLQNRSASPNGELLVIRIDKVAEMIPNFLDVHVPHYCHPFEKCGVPFAVVIPHPPSSVHQYYNYLCFPFFKK